MKKVMLIRHTTPQIEAGICYGMTNLPNAATHVQEVKQIKTRLNGFIPVTVFTSPLDRCKSLANELFQLPLKSDARLCELNFGDWEMLKWNDIPIKMLNDWSNKLYEYKIPGGESFKDLHQRVMTFWDETVSSHISDNMAVVTHSGVIRALLMQFLNIPHDKIFNLDLRYGTIVELSIDNHSHTKVRFI